MFPADIANVTGCNERIRIWGEQSHPVGAAFVGTPTRA